MTPNFGQKTTLNFCQKNGANFVKKSILNFGKTWPQIFVQKSTQKLILNFGKKWPQIFVQKSTQKSILNFGKKWPQIFVQKSTQKSILNFAQKTTRDFCQKIDPPKSKISTQKFPSKKQLVTRLSTKKFCKNTSNCDVKFGRKNSVKSSIFCATFLVSNFRSIWSLKFPFVRPQYRIPGYLDLQLFQKVDKLGRSWNVPIRHISNIWHFELRCQTVCD